MPRNLKAMLIAAAVVLSSGAVPTPFTVDAAVAQPSSCYTTFWPSRGRVVEIDACDYDSGGSGYIVLRNLTRDDLSVCWTLHFADGSTSDGCRSRLAAGDESRSSCSSCSRKKTGGVRTVTWRKVEVL